MLSDSHASAEPAAIPKAFSCRGSAARIPLLLALAACALIAGAAPATLTAPVLAISAVDIQDAEDDGVLIRVEGTFPFADMIDEPYPMMLFIRPTEKNSRGDFLCISGPWGPMRGRHPIVKTLKVGLTEEVLERISPTLEAAPDVTLVSFDPQGMSIRVPEDFHEGKAEVQLFVIYREAPLFSNVFPFEIKGEKW